MWRCDIAHDSGKNWQNTVRRDTMAAPLREHKGFGSLVTRGFSARVAFASPSSSRRSAFSYFLEPPIASAFFENSGGFLEGLKRVDKRGLARLAVRRLLPPKICELDEGAPLRPLGGRSI
jgi:hypothetical protein